MAEQIIVTDEGLKKLTEELDYLKNTKRKEVVEAIRIALSFGDLSENSEYDEAKNEQAKVEARISELEEQLKNVIVKSKSEIHTNSVNVGVNVKVKNENTGKESVYMIVGSTEADPFGGKISDQSPIGSALLGHKVGDKVIVEAPSGAINFTILDITK